MKASVKGALLASAVALAFVARTAMAQDAGASGSAAKVQCVGANDCKGQGACKGGGHDCKGQNSCKGKGWVETSSAKECTDKGGKVSQ
jgi:hypothetical protein